MEVFQMRKWLIMLLLLLPLPALSESFLALQPMSADAQARFLRNVSLVVWQEDYAGRAVECFDVRADGTVALGFSRPRGGKYAAVIDADGAFLYGYVFQCTGSFRLDWTDEGLGIIWVRSGVLAVFDESGACLSAQEVDLNTASSRYLRGLEQRTRTAAGSVYTLGSDGRLVRRDAQGTEIVLHDGSRGTLAMWIGIGCVVVFVGVCLAVSLRKRHAAGIDNPHNS